MPAVTAPDEASNAAAAKLTAFDKLNIFSSFNGQSTSKINLTLTKSLLNLILFPCAKYLPLESFLSQRLIIGFLIEMRNTIKDIRLNEVHSVCVPAQ